MMKISILNTQSFEYNFVTIKPKDSMFVFHLSSSLEEKKTKHKKGFIKMQQYGFLFDPNICIGCHTCQFACSELHQLAPDNWFRRVLHFEREDNLGFIGTFSAGCNHCEKPACVAACPMDAMYRNEEWGTVLHNDLRCIGCGSCVWACPYGAVSIDEASGRSYKCDGCIKRRMRGEDPVCVSVCPTNALRFAPIEESEAAGGVTHVFSFMPAPESTRPLLRVIPTVERDKFKNEE